MQEKLLKETQDMVYLHKKGASFSEIARRYGVSRQAVQQRLRRCGRGIVVKQAARMVFPKIAEWMIDNNIKISALADKIGVFDEHLNPAEALRQRLCGEIRFTVAEVNAVLDVTGLSYEVAFRGAEEDEQAEG